MALTLVTLLAAALIINGGADLAQCSSFGFGSGNTGLRFGNGVNGDANSAQYSVIINRFQQDDKCNHRVFVSGKGIKDTFETICAYNNNTCLTSDELMVFDSPEAGLSLFTDKPSILAVVKNGTCSKRSYTTKGDKTTSTSKEMTDKECNEVKKRIKDEVKGLRNEDASDEQSDGTSSNSDSDEPLDSWNF